jgi:hypothetical protein
MPTSHFAENLARAEKAIAEDHAATRVDRSSDEKAPRKDPLPGPNRVSRPTFANTR